MSTLHDLQAAARQTLVSVATQPIAQGLSSLQASAQGLSSDEARTRLAQLGPNVVWPMPGWACCGSWRSAS